MPFLKTEDNAEIFFKDWGHGQPIMFLHGWPLTADMWDHQMLVFGHLGFRVIAHDRRGFGRSSQQWEGNDYNHAADDLAALIAHLDLSNIVLVGHSMAGAEIARYVARHGTGKLAKIVTIAANIPQILQTETNPDGAPLSDFDDMRRQLTENRSEFLRTMPKTPFGFNKLTHKTNQGFMDAFWHQGMQGGIKPLYDFIAQFSETDSSEALKKIDVPTLIIHGGADDATPIKATAERAANLIPGAILKVYEDSSHMINMIDAERFNEDLLTFIRA